MRTLHPLCVEQLESRWMLSATAPTDLEQYLVELINRARDNPTAEAARLGVDLNEGLTPGTITPVPKQPVTIDPELLAAARGHSQWMISSDQFSHTGSGGSTPQARMKAAGYAFNSPWSWSENLAIRSYRTSTVGTDVLDAIHRDLFVDVGIEGRGHRINLLGESSREIGPGLLTGQFTYFPAAVVTQNFASSGSAPFLTGVVYTDAKVKDSFYTPGEGLGGVTITATRSDGQTYSTQTWSSGGYSLKLSAGVYTVTASGGSLSKAITYSSITVGAENVKADFTGAGTVQTPTTPTAPTTPTKPTTPTTPTTPTKPSTPTTPTKPTTPTTPTKPTTPTTPSTPSRPTDTTAPGATARAMRKQLQSRYYRFVVTYSDASGIQASTLGTGDVIVKGDGNYARPARIVSVDRSGNRATLVVTYEVKGPRGKWDAAHNGGYTLWIAANQVKDTQGNAITAKQIGSFTVRVPAVVPASTLSTTTRKKSMVLG